MRQFSIKNDLAADLLDQVTSITGEGKTDAIVHALTIYRNSLTVRTGGEPVLEAIRQKVHSRIKAEYLGKAPSKAEIEDELGMP